MRLLTGSAGSGKTAFCLDRVREAVRAGRQDVRLLTPTATMAQHLRNRLARDGLVLRGRIVQTLHEFVEEWAGGPIPTATSAVSEPVLYLIVEEVARRVARPEFAGVVQLPGFCAALAGSIAEFSAAGCNAARLGWASLETPLGEAFLAVYEATEKELERRGMALRADRLARAAARIEAAGAGGIGAIWLDGFHALPEPELRVVAALGRCTEVTLTFDWAEPRLLAMGFREERLARVRPSPARVVLRAPSIEREAEEIARRILEQAAAGRPFREMGIVVRAADVYVPLLRTTLERFGIPARFYFDEDLEEHAVTRFLSGAVDALEGGWDHAQTMAVLRLKAGLAGDALDRMDFAVREQTPNSGLEGLRALAGGAEELLRAIDALAGLEEWRGLSLRPVEWVRRLGGLRGLFCAVGEMSIHRRGAEGAEEARRRVERECREEAERAEGEGSIRRGDAEGAEEKRGEEWRGNAGRELRERRGKGAFDAETRRARRARRKRGEEWSGNAGRKRRERRGKGAFDAEARRARRKRGEEWRGNAGRKRRERRGKGAFDAEARRARRKRGEEWRGNAGRKRRERRGKAAFDAEPPRREGLDVHGGRNWERLPWRAATGSFWRGAESAEEARRRVEGQGTEGAENTEGAEQGRAWDLRVSASPRQMLRAEGAEETRRRAGVEREMVLAWRSQAAALDLFDEALGEAATALGDRAIPLAGFWRAVKSVLRLKPLRLADGRRNLVHVLSAPEARQWVLPVVFVCGMVQKGFPQVQPQQVFFPDEARRRLNAAGIGVRTAADFEREERGLFDAAVSRATVLVTVSYPQFDARGDRTVRSLFLDDWAEAEEMARAVRPVPRVAIAAPRGGEIAAPLVEYLRQRTGRVSPSRLETFLQCPFEHMAMRTLRLKTRPPRPEKRLDFLTQGSIVHAVLAEWYPERPELEPIFDRLFVQHRDEKRIPVSFYSERMRNDMLDHLRFFLAHDEWPRGEFRSRVEQAFEIPMGDWILSGKMDRLDEAEDGRAFVIDYKYSRAENTKKKLKDENLLQAPLYLMAAERRFGVKPTGMFYIGLKGGTVYVGWSATRMMESEPMPPDWIAETEQKALRIVAEIRAGRMDVKPANPDHCRFCDAKDVCRVEVRGAMLPGGVAIAEVAEGA